VQGLWGRRAATVVAGFALLCTACRDDRVVVTYDPSAGATYTYTVHIESTSTSTFPGRNATPRDVADLQVRQRVLDTNGDTIRVEVTLDRVGVGERTFVMRFDRAAQLTAVESVEGIPAEALGDLGLAEIFPAAAGAPPVRKLRPGDRWTIDDHVQLPGMASPASLTGEGRLVELGVVDGHDTATVESSTSLPVSSTVTNANSVQMLTGVDTTSITVVYDLADGSVLHSTSDTKGTFSAELTPPEGRTGAPIQGTVSVDVRSDIRRTG
jgi:hypothetical protein